MENGFRCLGEEPHAAADHLVAAVRACHPEWQRVPAVTFRARSEDSPAWTAWMDDVFSPGILPSLIAAHGAGDLAAILAADAAVALPDALAAASQSAGWDLAGRFTAPAAEKRWARFRQAVLDGDSPGHLAVLVAMRAAAFHLPLQSLLAAYLFLEARGTGPELSPALRAELAGAASRSMNRPARLRAA